MFLPNYPDFLMGPPSPSIPASEPGPTGQKENRRKQMKAPYLFLASISLGLLAGHDHARAQDAPTASQMLPPVVVTGTKQGVKRGRDQTATRVVRSPPVARVYPTTPLAGSSIDIDRVPASINIVDANQIKRTDSLNITDALQHYVPGVSINEVAGNPFTPSVDFRGFVGSPVSGTPQGLAVYQNGVRINEAFGDTVNWDLIPTAAIKTREIR